jgi:hypothetical protein
LRAIGSSCFWREVRIAHAMGEDHTCLMQECMCKDRCAYGPPGTAWGPISQLNRGDTN